MASSGWDDNLTALNQILLGFYSTNDDIRRLLRVSDISPAYVNFNGNSMSVWSSALDEARKRRRVNDLVRSALVDYPDEPTLMRALDGALLPDLGPEPDEQTWQASLGEDQTERLMESQSSLLPVGFLRKGSKVARSVALVRTPAGSGTGFLIADDLLVTNNHVLPSIDDARSAGIVFDFEQTQDGSDANSQRYRLDPSHTFVTSAQNRHDWTVVRVRDNPTSVYGSLDLAPMADSDWTAKGDNLRWVNIIQHPFGGPKAIAIYHNLLTYRDANYMLYTTDAQPGSSGSPIFDSDWRVVGLHRGFKYASDAGKRHRAAFRNWGTTIDRVIARDQ